MNWHDSQQTSIEAFNNLDLPKRQRQVLEVVKEKGSGTARELYMDAGGFKELGVFSGFQPRLKELEEKDVLERKYKKKCDVTGRTAYVWRLKK